MKKIVYIVLWLFLIVLLSISIVYVYNYIKYQSLDDKITSNETMHIVFGIDNNYVEPLNVTITSILWNNRNSRIQFHVISEDLTLNNKERIKTIVSRFQNANVSFYNTTVPKEFEKILKNEIKRITKATFLRLYIVELLPTMIDRVLYLDADIIVDGNINSLYKIEFNNNYIIGVTRDSDYEKYHTQKLSNYQIKQYVNAGVLLFNIKKLREEYNLSKMVNFIYDNLDKSEITLADQDIINIFWQDKILKTDDIYNKNMQFENKKKAVILHYVGTNKPWRKNASRSNLDYIQQIPWHIYNGLYRNIINNNSYAKTIWYVSLRDIYNGSVFGFYKIIDNYNQYINYPITGFIEKLMY